MRIEGYTAEIDIRHFSANCTSKLIKFQDNLFLYLDLQLANFWPRIYTFIELSTDKRVHQIREDHRKGVFVEGVMEKKLTSYKHGIDALLEGDKTRKIAFTSMNT